MILQRILRPSWLFACVLMLIFSAAILSVPLQAQTGLPSLGADQCAPIMTHLWTTASNACVNKPVGYACNGGAPPAVEPASVLENSFSPVGALVDVAAIDAIDTPPIVIENVTLGVVWMRLPEESNATLLLVGDLTMYDVTPPGFAAWTSSLLVTNPAPPTCGAAPLSGLLVQTPVGRQANLVINGSSLAIIGTALVHTTEDRTFFSMISGRSTVFSQGQRQSLVAGQMTSVQYPPGNFSFPISAPALPSLIDPAPLDHLPIPLFDRPLLLPQPGYLTTISNLNLRTAPDIYAAVLNELGGGEVLTLLGANPDQTWYHVQLDNGTTGWVFAELLTRNVGQIAAIYEATPLPPQRYGELGTRARVSAEDGANLRRGPDVSFQAIARIGTGTLVDLLARSPYGNGWLKVNAGGTEGWMSPFTLDTQAFLEALPIDWNAPPMPIPPTATPVPGSFGNAFPDPDG